MGGISQEHSISVKSGNGVLKGMDLALYEPLPILIHTNGKWEMGGQQLDLVDALPLLRDLAVDCVFIALHGPFGEDGRIQGLLDLLGLPYTGSGCAASALAMDKIRCKAVCQVQGIPVAGHIALDQPTWKADPQAVEDAVKTQIGFPCVIKAASQGSSYGIAMPQSLEEFAEGMEQVFSVDSHLMVETYVQGVEVTCSVLQTDPNGMIHPLPLTEIRPKSAKYFNFEAKYTPGATEEITPARIDPALADQVREIAVDVHQMVGCKGWSRSDFIIAPEGPIWIEVNTVPGLTETSLFPQAAQAAGISYSQLINLLIQDALRTQNGKGLN